MATPLRSVFQPVLFSLSLLAWCVLGTPLPALAEKGAPPGVHYWVDEHGTTHISRHPPPPGAARSPRPARNPAPKRAATGSSGAAASEETDAAPARIAPPRGDSGVFDHGLLFRIEDRSGPVGYVFGTTSLNHPRITDVPDPVRMALRNSETLCMDGLPDEKRAAELRKMNFNPSGTKLSSLLGPELYSQTSAALTKEEIPIQNHEKLPPWEAALLLSGPTLKRYHPGLRRVLYVSALQSGKSLCSLETPEELFAPLVSLPLEVQIAGLREVVEDPYDIEDEEVIRHYLARDTSALADIETRWFPYLGTERGRPYFTPFLDNHNSVMVERLLPRLKRRDATFVALSVLHLPGEGGVLAKLQDRGYRVTRVY